MMRPGLVFQPQSHTAFQRGINTIANAVRPTLGPLPRMVAIDHVFRDNKQPEILDNGGLIARRIVALPDRDADMGAMLLRQLIWKQHEIAGDGTATAAVLFQAVFNEGLRYIAAGGSPMRLRHYLESGMKVILDQMAAMTVPLRGQEQINQLALSVCHDEPLARALGESFDVIGEHGLLEIRSGRSRTTEQDFFPGSYYKGGLLSYGTSGKNRVELAEAALFISDLDIEEPQQLVRLIALAFAAQKRSLVIVARKMADPVSGVLASVNQKNPAQFQVIAVHAPDAIRGQAEMLDDLAVLTGGRVFLRAVSDDLDAATLEDLGAARRAWADKEFFGIIGGKGKPAALRAQVSSLRRAFEQTEDMEMRKKLRERIGKLMGGAAMLHVGGTSNLEIQTRKANAERCAEALRGALSSGILPGGGAALLACRPTLERMAQAAKDLDERMAYRILSRALEEPARAIMENAGCEAAPILKRMTKPGTGYDVRGAKIVDMSQAGINDSAHMLMSAVHHAVATAALALTVDVLVHHRKPEVSNTP